MPRPRAASARGVSRLIDDLRPLMQAATAEA